MRKWIVIKKLLFNFYIYLTYFTLLLNMIYYKINIKKFIFEYKANFL